jgi:pyruvate/2-oxoglutarate dehydrogenase complex dihydrolipoamide dehydrogenase (E3) component
LVVAKTAADLGARVALIEKERLGGAELWTGRIPMQTLLKTARIYDLVQRATEFGVRVESSRLIWNAVQLRIAAVRDEIKALERQALARSQVEVVYGTARFEDASTLHIAGRSGEQSLHAMKFILATGSRLCAPPIEGLQEIGFLTQDRIFEMRNLPRSCIIIGAGPRGSEIAQALAHLGCQVTVLQSASTLLPEEDAEISTEMEKLLSNEGVQVFCEAQVLHVRMEGEKKQVEFAVGGETRTATASEVLVIAEEIAQPDIPGLEAAAVRRSEQGVLVDEYLQTSASNIWACGSVAGKFHAPEEQGILAAENALKSSLRKFDASATPRTIFTDPEIARIGLTEAQARSARRGVRVHRREFSECERAIIEGETQGFVKVVASESGGVLGVHIIGANASERIERFVAAVREEAPISSVLGRLA